MVITRKIEIFICESDKDTKRVHFKKLYDTRNAARKAANMVSSHLFMLDNSLPYLSKEDRETLTFLGATGEKATKRNAPYVVLSSEFKGKISMGMLSNVAQNVSKSYQSDIKELYSGRRSLRSYRSNIPIPFQKKAFINLRSEDYQNKEGKTKNGVFFSVSGIPFQIKFGRDRSGNRCVIDRVISGDYKMCTSSIQIDDKKNKTYLLLCVDIPKKKTTLVKGKTMYAFLGVINPITCTTQAYNPYTDYKKGYKVWGIGTAEEFFHGRRQIQESLHRAQKAAKYNKGGKGRKRKLQSIDRFELREKNYVETKLHTYSRELVNMAVKHECDTIYLMLQHEREEAVRNVIGKKDAELSKKDLAEKMVLRNWSYYGLKDKIKYKAAFHGITMKMDKDIEDEE